MSPCKAVMYPGHPGWTKFIELLMGSKGCDFRYDENQPSKVNWNCHGDKADFYLTRRILEEHFPDIDVNESLSVFKAHGAYCDCEVIFNVEDSYRAHDK